MKNFSKHIIQKTASILEAIAKLDIISSENLTLFVCDQDDRMFGTLTDGDVRRGLLKGLDTSVAVSQFMAKDFSFVNSHGVDVFEIKKFRKKGVKLLPCLTNEGKISKVYDLVRLKSVLPLECMIMAGGKGERLRPLTDNTPKPMLKLADKPIIEHNIDRLIQYGIEKIYISIKYLGEQIKDYFGDGSAKGILIEYIEEEKFLGTGGAIRLVEKFESEHILIMNSDLFTDVDFEDLYLNTLNADAEIGIASIPYTVNIPYAILEREDNRVLSFKEKPNNTHYANAGIYIIKRELIERIPSNEFYNITDLIQNVLDQGGKVIQNPIYGYWIDIGKHEDYKKAQEFVKHIKY
ncbi:nucleotidyltransferase [Labilibaculum manganireducens]|uniref:Nucleotidyltransferase n=1 Tax=Labilibaculum manganireducens TaxID=1940525 RepID=A0A2N3IEM4_9BACT|nr:nucleotidyltransferase family protein [Labilibaculum manganireducens]PKQ68757.1 nucleotidyltransferase [Labilibaculum manganireducens]